MAEYVPTRRPAARTLGVREFRAHVTTILREAQRGSSFVITSRGEVVAEIHPPSAPVQFRREPGALRGKIRIAPDFNALPPDILAAMEGEAD